MPSSDVLELNPFFYRESKEDKADYWAVMGRLIGRETARTAVIK